MPKHIMGDLSTEGTEDAEEAAGRLREGGTKGSTRARYPRLARADGGSRKGMLTNRFVLTIFIFRDHPFLFPADARGPSAAAPFISCAARAFCCENAIKAKRELNGRCAARTGMAATPIGVEGISVALPRVARFACNPRL